jgi:hypothetical protein
MKLYFGLLTSDKELGFTPESELMEHQDFLAPKERTHIAKLTMINDQGDECSIIDEMWHVALHLGRFGLERIMKGETYTYSNMMTGRPTEFITEGDWITIKSEENKEIRYDKYAFIEQMFDCGTRYFDLLERLPHLGHEQSVAIFKSMVVETEELIENYINTAGNSSD